MTTVRARRRIAAPPSIVWRVVADHGLYASMAPNLSEVEVLDGAGLGMRRRCADATGRDWSETCTLWDEGRRFAFEVDTDAPAYPYPLRRLRGEWAVEPAGGGSVIALRFDAEPRGIRGRIALALARPAAWLVCRRLFANWEREIAARAAVSEPRLPASA